MQIERNILIVDDHPVFRAGLRYIVNEEPDLNVTAEAECVSGALAEIKKTTPDIVVSDISLKGRSGMELIRNLSERYPLLSVLVVSMHDEATYAERVLTAGAKGFIAKEEMSEKVIEGIRTVLDGDYYFSREISNRLFSRFGGKHSGKNAHISSLLTDRELEVFHLIGDGLDSRQISRLLHVSIKTIGTYKENIKKKLNIETSSGLIRRAVIWNLESKSNLNVSEHR